MSKELEAILKQQKELLAKIEELEKRIKKLKAAKEVKEAEITPETAGKSLGIVDLLRLPDNIRRTVLAIFELKEATAEEVAAKTGRTRNIESVYLNELVRSDYLGKGRKGRKVFFKIKFAAKKTVAELVEKGWRL